MPSRVKKVRRVDSEVVQGDGSWVDMLRPKGRALKEAMRVNSDNIGEDGDKDGLKSYEYNEGFLQAHIKGWNWVDDDGEPLAQPKDDIAVFDELTLEEVNFLSEHLMETKDPKN